jgi:hypothetical protein
MVYKVSEEMMEMLQEYARLMHDTSLDAHDFFSRLKAELSALLRSRGVTPPADIKIINPKLLPRARRGNGDPLPCPDTTIGILCGVKDMGVDNEKTQVAFRRYLRLDVAPTREYTSFLVHLPGPRKIGNSIPRTHEVADILAQL